MLKVTLSCLNVDDVAQGRGFSLSVASVGQMMKMGVSVEFGVCKGKRKDGMACTMAINKYVFPPR